MQFFKYSSLKKIVRRVLQTQHHQQISFAIAVTLYYAVPAAIYVYDRYTAPDLNPMPVRTIGLEVADDVPAIYNTSGEVTIAPAAYEQAVPVPNKTITKIDGREVVKLQSEFEISETAFKNVEPNGGHSFARGRLDYLGNQELVKSNTIDFVNSNKYLLNNGSNSFQGTINGNQTTILIDVSNNMIRSVNIYPGISQRVPTSTINFGSLTW